MPAPIPGSLGQTGPSLSADGSPQGNRYGNEQELVTTPLRGKFAESCRRGQLFSVTTPAAGAAPGTALGTTAAIDLFNPQGSGVVLEVCRVTLGYISGTLGAGTVYHTANPNQGSTTPTSGTVITPQSQDIGNKATSRALAGTGRTLSTTPTALYPFCILEASLATSPNGPSQVIEDTDGAICIEPGGCYALEAIAAAGSTPLVSLGIVYRERQILQS